MNGDLKLIIGAPALERFRVCLVCGGLRGPVIVKGEQCEQRCDCLPPAPEWPAGDFPESIELCRLCAGELTSSGHRYCVWFCSGCKASVHETARRGGPLVPIGRHSVHLIPPQGRQAPPAAEGGVDGVVERVMRDALTLRGACEATARWRALRVAWVAERSGFEGSVGLSKYLRSAAGVAPDPRRLLQQFLAWTDNRESETKEIDE